MNESENQSTATLDEGFTRTWRYKVGLSMIVGGHVTLLIGALLPFPGMGAAISGALILGGEVISLASIVFLGKEGFKAIKNNFLLAIYVLGADWWGKFRRIFVWEVPDS